MASYTVKNYSAYASSMAKPSSSSTSSRLDSKGYTPVSTTAKPTTAAAKTYQDKYAARDNYESPSSSKSKPSMGLGAPTKKPTAVAAPTVEDRFANAWTLSGGSNYDNPMSQPPSAIGVYETPKAQELVNYMTSAGIQDALYEAQGLINQNYTPQMQMSVRPMNADEIKKFVPVQNLNNSGITVEQLSSMDAPQQKATLESLGITNARFVSSQGMYPMSLQEFDDITMDSVHYGQPAARDPKNAMYNQLQQPTEQGLGYTGTDAAPDMPSAEQVAILPDAPGMMSPATLGEVPSVDTLSNQMLEVPEVPAVEQVTTPSAGLMSRPEQGPVLYPSNTKSVITYARDIFPDNPQAAAALAATIENEGMYHPEEDIGKSGNYQLKKVITNAKNTPALKRNDQAIYEVLGFPKLKDKDGNIVYLERPENDVIKDVQTALNKAGFNVGKADGVAGKNTKAKIKQFQATKGLEETGKLDDETIKALNVDKREVDHLGSPIAMHVVNNPPKYIPGDKAEAVFNIRYHDHYRGASLGSIGDTPAKYIGRGPIQITGEEMYRKVGERIGVDLVKNPELVATDPAISKAATKAWLDIKGFGNKTPEAAIKIINPAMDSDNIKKRLASYNKFIKEFE